MENPFFTGVCTALVTPFLGAKVNYPMLQRLLQYQMDSGIEAVVIAGTTGESPTLSDEEKVRLFETAKNYVQKDCKIIAGTGSNSTAHAVSLSIQAEQAGADALLVVSPYYNKGTEEGLFAHYLSIAHAVTIPVILYNVPSRTGVDIPISVYKRLSKVPNIIGVKEAGTDIAKLIEIRNACGTDFTIWSGNDDLAVPAISVGGQGVISVASNICPHEMAIMVDAALDGDFDTASAIAAQMQPLIKLLFAEVNPVMVKEGMKCIGFDCGKCRLPLTLPKKENIEKLQNYFAK